MFKKFWINNNNKNFSMAVAWINGGSNFDKKNKKGINQILCSLLSRGCKGFDNLSLSEYIDSHGAELSFDLDEDGILISLRSLNEYFNKLFPLIDLIIENPTLSKNEFINVKKSTLGIIKKSKENIFNIAYEEWRKIVYLDHPYGFNSLGYEKDISKINHNDVINEYNNFKLRDKYLISNQINDNYLNLENFANNIRKIREVKCFPGNNINLNNRFIYTPRESNQIVIMLGNQTCPYLSNDYLPLKILESHLSFGMSSVLFKQFREKNGLTYDVGVFNPVRRLNAPFLIYLSVSNENAYLAIKILKNLWMKILKDLLTTEEIKLAKDKFKASLLHSNQTLEEIINRKIKLIGYNLSPNSDLELLKKLELITSSKILEVSVKHLSKPFLSMVGEKNICKKINEKWTYDF